jgi:hypothetical protein
MATQRITIAKIAGRSGEVVVGRFRAWSASRATRDPGRWSPGQWPEPCRRAADGFADALRAHGYGLPVVYFSEHLDSWSMGDLFGRWLSPPGGPGVLGVHANRFELFCYPLPDVGALEGSLRQASRSAALQEQAPPEERWFVGRLLEAAGARAGPDASAGLILLREVLGGSLADEEVAAALRHVPSWVADIG